MIRFRRSDNASQTAWRSVTWTYANRGFDILLSLKGEDSYGVGFSPISTCGIETH
jgi:hypothetical protein